MSLDFVSVTRRFGAQLALDGLSIRVRDGDCYGFIGHNGAGKTTAMRIALGLQRCNAGRVLVDGLDVRSDPSEARARMGGLIEVPGFHAALDGAKNLALLARLQGMGRSESRREALRLLEVVGLDSAIAKPVQAYSQGMRQRLGIAQALLGRPAYVLLDEPTNGLDPEGIADVRKLLRRLVDEERTTVLLSSHQLHEISDLCNRIGVLHRGRLVVEEETSVLLSRSSDRYELATDDDARAAELLARLAIAHERLPRGGIQLELAGRVPGEIPRAVVGAGLELRSFAPRPTSLEEIYLRYARGGEGERSTESQAHGAAAVIVAPGRRAPRAPTLRVARYELARWFARGRLPWLVVLPAAIAGAAVLQRHAQLAASSERVEQGELFSATDVTAFEGVAVALRAGLPLLALLVGGLASQQLAGELSRGTLRNVLLRPLRRIHAVAGKALALLVLVLGAYALLAGISVGLSGFAFDFRDVQEILPNGERFSLVSATQLWPELRRALAAPLLPLLACASVGFLAGAAVRSAAGALALALGSLLFLDLARSIARGFDVEAWLPSAYLPSPLGDTSFLAYYSDVAQAVSNTSFAYASTATAVPLAWCAAAFALAAALLSRRSIP